jgi:Flp pilus assembly protein protease CpaA
MKPEAELAGSETEPMPYGVAIAWGAIAALFWWPPIL